MIGKAATALILCMYLMIVSGCGPRRCDYSYTQILHKLPSPIPCKSQEVCPSMAAVPSCEGQLSLAAAVRRGLQQNPDVSVAMARIQQSSARLYEAQAAFHPHLAVGLDYLRTGTPSDALFKRIDQRQFSIGTNFNYPGTLSNYETKLQLRQNLYRGCQDLLERWRRETGLQLSEASHQELLNFLTAAVVHSYFEVLTAQDLLIVAQQAQETVQQTLRQVQARYEEGTALRSELLRLETRLAETKQRVVQFRSAEALAMAALAQVLGDDPEHRYVLVQDGWDYSMLPQCYEQGIVEALDRRPELRQAQLHVEDAALAQGQAQGSFEPRVDAAGDVFWDDPGLNYYGRHTNWRMGVGVSWDLYDGGQRWAQLCYARHALDEMLALDRKTTLSVQLDVKTAYLRWDEAVANQSVAQATVQYAEEALTQVKAQYEEGTATVAEYLDAQLSEVQAQMSFREAKYLVQRAQAEIARAIGLVVFSGEERH